MGDAPGGVPYPCPLRQSRETVLYGVEDLRLREDHPHLVLDAVPRHADFFPARDDGFGEIEALLGGYEVHGGDVGAGALACQ